MQLTEQHVIGRDDPRFAAIDAAAFKSKNLYNAALYQMRQAFIFQGKRLFYQQMDKLMQQHEAYKALPAKVAQQVLKQLGEAWDSYFKACEAYKADPSKFRGHPKLPKYKHKTQGRNLLVYTLQALHGGQSKRGIRGVIQPSGLPVTVKTKQRNVNQVRIVPRKGFYVVEIIYEQEVKQASVDPAYYAGIDIGVNNLVALTSNKPGFQPVVVNGRPVKSINQYYVRRVTHFSIASAGSQNWKEYSGVI